MKKTILSALVISLFLALPWAASAATTGEAPPPNPGAPLSLQNGGSEITPFSSTSCTLGFTKLSSTTARGQAMANRPGATTVTSTIRLQKKSGGTFVNTSSYGTKTVKANQINHIKDFSISSSQTYRIKVTIKYTSSGVTRSNTYYKSLS